MTNSFPWPVSVIKAVLCASATVIYLWPMSGLTQGADQATFAPDIQQKLEARSAPAQVTSDDESTLTSKGYIKIGTIRASQPGNRASAAATEQLQTAILRKVAEAGGDVVRFSREGIFEEADVPTGRVKRKGGTCAQYSSQTVSGTPTSSTSCYTDVHGFAHCMTTNTPTTRSISSCVSWVGGEEIPITKREKSVISEGTVWRYDPHGDIARAVAAAQRQAAAAHANYITTIDGGHFIKLLEDDKLTLDEVKEMVNANPGLLTAENSDGERPLHVAAHKGSVELVNFLLAKGADVYATAWLWHGDTPLHTAAMYGQKDVVKLLLAHGVDVNVMNTYHETPLHEAEKFQKSDVAEVLRAHGGGESGPTPEEAREYARKTTSTDADSRQAGSDINARDYDGYTPLIRAIRDGKLEDAKALLDRGADVNASAGEPAIDKGSTPLLEASAYLPALMKTLVERGANIDAVDLGHDTPLNNAACGRDPEILKLLLAKGANINMQDGIDRTPLMHAVVCPAPENVKVLLASGADKSLKDYQGKTAMVLAQEHVRKAENSADRAKYELILQLLRQDTGAKVTSGAPTTSGTPSLDSLTALATQGLTKEMKQKTNGTMDDLRVIAGTPLDKPNAMVATSVASAPLLPSKEAVESLHRAIVNGDHAGAESLVAHDADINARDTKGGTLLHYAVGYGYMDVAEMLLVHGADANVKEEIGQTPLHIAACGRNKELVELLLAHGADVNAKANDGSTPLSLAAYFKNRDIVDLLRQHGGHK